VDPGLLELREEDEAIFEEVDEKKFEAWGKELRDKSRILAKGLSKKNQKWLDVYAGICSYIRQRRAMKEKAKEVAGWTVATSQGSGKHKKPKPFRLVCNDITSSLNSGKHIFCQSIKCRARNRNGFDFAFVLSATTVPRMPGL
jgi:hypothetical protein